MALTTINESVQTLKKEIQKTIIGQDKTIDILLTGLLSDGHILLEGVPGLAKTTAVKTLASAIGLGFHRVQFTPDLLPSDIIGVQIYNPKDNAFAIKKGPIFTHILLADEINRSPAKVQSALLEVMQEKQVTIGEESYLLEEPFLVLATQNPIEQEGAYLLPEAQLDRFMFKIIVDYNTQEEEFEIAKMTALGSFQTPQKVLNREELQAIKTDISKTHIDDELIRYIVMLIDATRHPKNYELEELEDFIEFGASPRGTINLIKASKTTAFLRGFDFVSPVDIAYIFKETLRHRIVLSYEAEAQEVSSDDILNRLLKTIPIP